MPRKRDVSAAQAFLFLPDRKGLRGFSKSVGSRSLKIRRQGVRHDGSGAAAQALPPARNPFSFSARFFAGSFPSGAGVRSRRKHCRRACGMPSRRTLPAVLQKAIMAAEAPATASGIETAAFSADTEDTKTPRNPSGIRGAPDDLDGAEGQNRTAHTGIFSPLLYQLSYLGTTKVNLLQLKTNGKLFFSVFRSHGPEPSPMAIPSDCPAPWEWRPRQCGPCSRWLPPED